MKTVLSFIACLLLFANSLSAEGFLKRLGSKIVDGSGNEVLLKGMGLGGWLVPEGYMLLTSAFANSPSEIRKKISDLIGEENTEIFYDVYRTNYVSKKDIDSLAALGFNSIRLPMHYNIFTPKNEPGVWLEEGFLIVDSLLSWCESNELYLILDLHCAPGGQNHDNISDYDPNFPSLWQDTLNQTRTVELWKKLAERYANEEWIGGYDLINETAWDLPPNNQPLRDLFIRITNAIRSVDNNHIIYIEGNWYATDFSGLTPPWDNNMVYSFHKYWNANNIGSISNYLAIRNNYNVPLWLGETGENSNQWFVDCVEIMENNNIGWCWWPHKKIESIAGPFAARKTPEYDYLLKYWKGEVSPPTLQYAVDALNNMAKELNIDSCISHPDVIDALFRQVNSILTQNYKENNIPGIIFATNFDMGKNNYAYKDNSYHNISGPGGSTYNDGFVYRNDGVDIENCSDAVSNGYNVGWIENGEYLKYTVNISNSGSYTFKLRTASNTSGGKISVKLDNSEMTQFDIPVSGGWQNWITLIQDSIYLIEGIHDLIIHFINSGFNLNYIEFILDSPMGIDDLEIIETFELKQNYPNPFNPKTIIEYKAPSDDEVTLKIYDMLGNNVLELLNPQGENKFIVEADQLNLASGIYFYRAEYKGILSSMKKAVLLK